MADSLTELEHKFSKCVPPFWCQDFEKWSVYSREIERERENFCTIITWDQKIVYCYTIKEAHIYMRHEESQ